MATDVYDIIREMVKIQRKALKDMAFQLDTIDKMLKDAEEEKQSQNIYGTKNERVYDLKIMPPNEYQQMIKNLVDIIYEYRCNEFKNKSDILHQCYKKMDKEYSAGLKQKQIEYIQHKGYAPRSILEMISEFYNEYLVYKSVLLSMLEQMADEIFLKPEQTLCIPKPQVKREKKEKQKIYKIDTLENVVIPETLSKVSTFEEVEGAMILLKKKLGYGDSTNYIYQEIYKKIDEHYPIRWHQHTYLFRKKHGLSKEHKIEKKTLIASSPKLRQYFVEQFNIFLEEKLKEIGEVKE